MPFNRIAVIVAMEKEIQPLLKRLGAAHQQDAFLPAHPMKVYLKKFANHEFIFSLNGSQKIQTSSGAQDIPLIGSVPAAINTLKIIETFKPDLLISAGTAGGFKSRGGSIADIYLSAKIFYHDRRISVPGFKEFFDTPLPCMEVSKLATKFNLKLGTLTTGDSFDMTEGDAISLEKHKTDVKEMEAAAVATIAAQMNVPFFALKSITDLVDSKETATEQFIKNLAQASEILCSKLQEVLEYCVGKSPHDLGKN